MSVAITLHLLATIIWVGGMFFAHMALRPAVNALLEPPQRLPLLVQIFKGFFPWVWVSVIVIAATGYGIFGGVYHWHAGLHVHLMSLLGLVMITIFVFIYFCPFRRMVKAVAIEDWKHAGMQMAMVRRLVAVNLVLGLITSVIGVGGGWISSALL